MTLLCRLFCGHTTMMTTTTTTTIPLTEMLSVLSFFLSWSSPHAHTLSLSGLPIGCPTGPSAVVRSVKSRQANPVLPNSAQRDGEQRGFRQYLQGCRRCCWSANGIRDGPYRASSDLFRQARGDEWRQAHQLPHQGLVRYGQWLYRCLYRNTVRYRSCSVAGRYHGTGYRTTKLQECL